jgi:ribonuclease P protein component
MLKSKNRLTSKEFETTFQTGTKRRSKRFLFVLASGETTQVGVSVPKKLYKKAHERNRLRRFVYNSIHDIVESELIRGQLLIIVQQKIDDQTAARDELRTELQKINS